MGELRIRFSLAMAIFVLFAGTLPSHAEQAHSHDHSPQTVSPQGGASAGTGSPATPQQNKDPSLQQTPPSQGPQHGQSELGGPAMMKCPMMPMMPMMQGHTQPAAGGSPSSQSIGTMMQGMGLMMQGMGIMMQGMGMMHANPAPSHHHPH